MASAQKLIQQYNGFEPSQLKGQRVNGALTIGENIADLCGVSISHLAYRLSLDGKPAPIMDGLTGDQRFFISWGQVWRAKYRDAENGGGTRRRVRFRRSNNDLRRATRPLLGARRMDCR